MAKNIGILGTGVVAQAIAAKLVTDLECNKERPFWIQNSQIDPFAYHA